MTTTTTTDDVAGTIPTSSAISAADTSTADSSTGSIAYCEQVVRLAGERPEAYMGSSDQLADIGALTDVAPDALLAPLTTFAEFLRSGAITAEDPESNVVENWPPSVQAAIREITTYNEASC